MNPYWKVAFASASGRLHLTTGVPCQDAAAVARRGSTLAVAVADGAGSATLSHLGAQVVTHAVAAFLCRKAKGVTRGAVGAEAILTCAREAIRIACDQHGGTLQDYACTLLAVVLTDNKGAAIHLGDGVIAVVRRAGAQVLSAPDNGEFVNETVFVTSPSAVQHLRITLFDTTDITGLSLMTDGAQASLYSRHSGEVSPAVEQMVNWLDEGTEEEVSQHLLRNIVKHLLPRTSDDCTVLIIRRLPRRSRRCTSSQSRQTKSRSYT